MITVVGESVLDLVSRDGGRTYTAHPGGSPLNVAVGLARLGRPTAFVARISGGAPGEMLREHARANGVDLRWSVPAREPATLALVRIDQTRQPANDLYVEGTADWQWQDAEPRFPPRPRVLHAGSLASWTPPGGDRIAAALTRARAEDGVLVSFDPNVRPARAWYAGPPRVRASWTRSARETPSPPACWTRWYATATPIPARSAVCRPRPWPGSSTTRPRSPR
ncbi:sugar/nucleoside kinase (ribokinase family) [Thermocatellispora tengchongensis]|uniref:Sugar/nucleoside kinase (Ribokinase family) n=1 Tax=Thermocatellispora tengchongensis TaxID=1073253 RepID=A0A840P8U9_9ACTN|nr:PfkB family carbohydrate kinase [Thermocatellispora tengchongensis]MBB5137804.1 sugar/nucleoside kinase (ribokinase family) [Thermocatellispora tengchongensis]